MAGDLSGSFSSTRFTSTRFMLTHFNLPRYTRCQAAAVGRPGRPNQARDGERDWRAICSFNEGNRCASALPNTLVKSGLKVALGAFRGSGRDSLDNGQHGSRMACRQKGCLSYSSSSCCRNRRSSSRSSSDSSSSGDGRKWSSVSAFKRAVSPSDVLKPRRRSAALQSSQSSFTYLSPSEAEWRLMLTDIGVQPRKMARILIQYHAMPADVAMERIIFLQGLGIDTGKALSSFPKLLFYPPSTARAMADYLTSVGVKPGLTGKVLSACPQLLGLSIEDNICPTISHLVEAWGLDQSRDIPVVISRHPRCLTYSIPENLQPTLTFWLGSGIAKPAKLIRANPSILGLSTTKRILPSIAAFDSYGIPPHLTIDMVKKFPHLFNYSWNNNLMPKLQYLEEVGRGIDEAVQHPQYFGYSLPRRIQPRLGGVARAGLHVSLSFVLRLKDEDFERLYGDVCRVEGRGSDRRDEQEHGTCM